MATQSASAHAPGTVSRGGIPSSNSMPYPPLPASPTLTNPDMILPDYDRSDSPDERSQSPILMWDTALPVPMEFHMPPQNTFSSGPMTPTTPIIYGNGTMLSDIGEVTEVESTIGRHPRRTSSRYSQHSEDDTVLRSSPTVGNEIKMRSQITSRERRSSIESTSTITTQDQAAGAFADFDDAVSVDDSNFQGDDEESMASSYVDDAAIHNARAVSLAPAREANDDSYSTTSISQRAEQILANAKRRLTTMEGNLSRARSSLSYSSMSGGSTPSPPMVRPATSLRESTTATSPSHGRMMSENGIQNTSHPVGYPQRSASALGAAGGYRKPTSSSRSANGLDGTSGRAKPKSSSHTLDTTLESLSEDDDGSVTDSGRNSAQFTNLLSPTFGSYSDKGLTRSASVAQMRDLKDQMKDLKGKISSLKEQARADSMKRRSLQSLRTPSPFTHARWDQGFMEPRKMQTSENGTPPPDEAWNEEDDSTGTEEPPKTPVTVEVALFEEDAQSVVSADVGSQTGFKHEPIEEQSEQRVAEDDEEDHPEALAETDDVQTEYGDAIGDGEGDGMEELVEGELEENAQREMGVGTEVEEDEVEEGDEAANDDYDSESGDSLYHDTQQNAVSHEDREDAFDYEHFFLHSAMGTLSQQRGGRRGSSGSMSSDDSVATTRGPSLPRRTSFETTSSVESFATAAEGRASRSSLDEDVAPDQTEVAGENEADGQFFAKRKTFAGFGSISENVEDVYDGRPRQNSVLHRPISHAYSSLHRPSVSSFESTGTNRSFPLVNKAKLNGGARTPGGSPDHELTQISKTLMDDTTRVCDTENESGSMAMQMLSKDDHILVQNLVASLGKCILALSEGSRASPEGRQYRRRIDTARRALEGLDD